MAPEINLLRAKTATSPGVVQLKLQFNQLSFIAVGATLLVGLLITGIYFYLMFTLNNLTNQKRQLILAISGNARKETLFRYLKSQIGIAGAVMKIQKQWNSTLDLTGRVTGSSTLSSIGLNDNKSITLVFISKSVEDAGSTIAGVVSETTQNHLKSPVLQDFQMGSDGTIRMSISFSSLL